MQLRKTHNPIRWFLCILLIAILGLIPTHWAIAEVSAYAYDDHDYELDEDAYEAPASVKGKVLRVLIQESRRFETSGDDLFMDYQQVEIEILQGDHKGTIIIVDNYIDVYNMVVDKGYHVLLYLEEGEDGTLNSAFILEIVRDRFLYALIGVFALLLLALGGFKGLKVILTLILTGLAVVFVLLPLTMRGYPPVLVSMGICIAVIFATLSIINGINKKSVSAIIGTSGGVLLAGAIALFVGSAARLTGMGNEFAQLLMYAPIPTPLDFRGLLFAGIILGAMGAIMDVSMSIASAMHEIERVKPDIPAKDLIRAGMNVGRDVMGTMSNTLILAYAGGSLHLMMLYAAYQVPFSEIINRDIIASEVLRAMAGSIGLLFVIPLTALVAAAFSRNKAAAPTTSV